MLFHAGPTSAYQKIAIKNHDTASIGGIIQERAARANRPRAGLIEKQLPPSRALPLLRDEHL